MSEQERRDPRHLAAAEITYENRGVDFEGRIGDISAGGFYIDTLHPLPEGSVIRFQFVPPGAEEGEVISGEGVVAWTQKMLGMGIRITAMPEEDRKRLTDFLSKSQP